jgi:hypothetical protein
VRSGVIGKPLSARFGELARLEGAAAVAALERAWVSESPGPRETKTLLFTTGYALLSVESSEGQKKIQVRP